MNVNDCSESTAHKCHSTYFFVYEYVVLARIILIEIVLVYY
jgi:hypothetical protein